MVNHIALHNLQDSFLLVQEFITAGMPKISTVYTNLMEDHKASNEYNKLEGEELILMNMTLQSYYGEESIFLIGKSPMHI